MTPAFGHPVRGHANAEQFEFVQFQVVQQQFVEFVAVRPEFRVEFVHVVRR